MIAQRKLNTSIQSVKAYQIGGVPPSILAYCMEHSSHLDQYTDLMECYYLNYWSGKYILKEMVNGTIHKDDTLYHVAFSKSVNRGTLLRNDSLCQYRMSFRKALPYYNLPAFVYISL